MYFKIFFRCLLTSVLAFIVTLGMVYCAGRWQLFLIDEKVNAEVVGFVFSILGCYVVLHIFKEKKKIRKFMAFCFAAGLLLASFSKSSDLMKRVYVDGLEQAAFSVAPPEQWESTLMIAERYRMSPPKDQAWGWELLPTFVSKVYPGRGIYTGIIDDTTKTNNLHLLIFWRGASFTPAVEIGQLSPQATELSGLNLLYRKDYSNSISFMILGNDD